MVNTDKKHAQNNVSLVPDEGGRIWYKYNVDRPLLLIILTLLAIGTVMVFSASYAYAEMHFGDSYYFARRQIIWLAVGLGTMFLITRVNLYNVIYKFTMPFCLVILALNYLVPLIGIVSHGAKRWITIGPVNLQPSELLKFAVILFFAYTAYKYPEPNTFKFILRNGIVICACCFSTVLQSHLSATIIIAVLCLAMLFMSGCKMRKIGLLLLVGILAVAFILVVFAPFVEELLGHAELRIKVWSDPFKYMKDEETGDAGWQPAQSLYAIASGGLWGVGLSQSNEKHGWLPEPQNDYIFSILCEELGFFMAVVVIGLFAAFVWRGFVVAKKAPDDFSRMIIMGITLQIALQVALNIAVVTNTIPSTGISLPFFSYGGTSLCVLLAECGIMLSFSRYATEQKTDIGEK